MTGFSAEWLALRAPADDAARDAALVRRLTEWAAGRPLAVTDFGGGSGAAYRALDPALPGARWRIIDDDPALLAVAGEAQGVETAEIDLAANLAGALSPPPDLITAFAFIDLASEAWLAEFVSRAKALNAAIYAPLIYNGCEIWRPEPPHERRALAAFNADMRRDKGLGPALGSEAGPRLAQLAQAAGYRVESAESPWRLEPGPLLTALANGSAAAVASALSEAERGDWLAGRREAQSAEIGHIDILALPD